MFKMKYSLVSLVRKVYILDQILNGMTSTRVLCVSLIFLLNGCSSIEKDEISTKPPQIPMLNNQTSISIGRVIVS